MINHIPFNPQLSNAYRELAKAPSDTCRAVWHRRLDDIWRDIYARTPDIIPSEEPSL